MPQISVSMDKSKLDVAFVHQFLTSSYWATGRSETEVRTSIENSICFGVYENDLQIGFARVVTDTIIFANIMDVFIAKDKRGLGYSKLLLKTIFTTPDLLRVKRWLLQTKDAHGIYRQFGFQELENSDRYMTKIKS